MNETKLLDIALRALRDIVRYGNNPEAQAAANALAEIDKRRKWVGWKCPSDLCDWQDRSSYSERFEDDPCPRCKTPIVSI